VEGESKSCLGNKFFINDSNIIPLVFKPFFHSSIALEDLGSSLQFENHDIVVTFLALVF
jgi:hypothetical protein